MQQSFVVEADDEADEIRIQTAQIAFREKDGRWVIGIEISGVDEFEDEAILHLIDYPCPVAGDPRQQDLIELDFDDGNDVTNFYRQAHSPTEDNTVRISPADDGHFRVQWTGEAQDFEDLFRVDVQANEVKSIAYP